MKKRNLTKMKAKRKKPKKITKYQKMYQMITVWVKSQKCLKKK